MNEPSQCCLALGERVGLAYVANPKARVVMVAGSTERGTADRYSDVEIDVYWGEPPTDAECQSARLKAAFRLPPQEGVRQLHTVCDDVLALVGSHMPSIDTTAYRARPRQRRNTWDEAPQM
jgi:hypothetical protein